MTQYGIYVSAISIENIDFTDAYEAAIEAKQVATQEKQRAKTVQEQQTMETEQKAERAKIEAQAAADVAKINADAEAYTVKVQAEAQAEANKKINASLISELINYVYANNWDGKLPVYAGGDNIPVLNLGEN